MIINTTGKILENLYMIGHPDIPIYLLDGDNPVIFDAGFTALGDLYAAEIKKILGNRQPSFCLLTHSHFDHCGSVSILKRYFPSLKVAAAEKAKSIVGRPNAVALIRDLNESAEQMIEELGLEVSGTDKFTPFNVDITLMGDDHLEISNGITIQIMETPGHTRDCLSYYIPEQKLLFSSEAAGQPDHSGYIVSDCLVDYGCYLKSLGNLSRLNIETLCLGHLFVYTAEDAVKHMQRSLSECKHFYQWVTRCYQEAGGDLAQVKNRIKAVEYDKKNGPKQPEPAYLLNLNARIRAVLKYRETYN